MVTQKSIIVVSGLPRSGTSLMMQMLSAGGIDVVDDGKRPPDQNNPHGYFEDQRVRQLHLDTSWLSETRGKAIKVVSPLLHHLPASEGYKILFMDRPLPEVQASQTRMMERLGTIETEEKMKDLAKSYSYHLEQVHAWIDSNPNMDQLPVAFRELLQSPIPILEEIEKFLNRPLDKKAMAECVDPGLYRERHS